MENNLDLTKVRINPDNDVKYGIKKQQNISNEESITESVDNDNTVEYFTE